MLFDENETRAGLVGGDMDVGADGEPGRPERALRLDVDLDLDLMDPWDRRELVNEKTDELTAPDRKGKDPPESGVLLVLPLAEGEWAEIGEGSSSSMGEEYILI
jgi:hypothetical protein